jgi:hypothetical protein
LIGVLLSASSWLVFKQGLTVSFRPGSGVHTDCTEAQHYGRS